MVRQSRVAAPYRLTTIAVFRRQPVATTVVALVLLGGLLAPLLAPYDPAVPHMADRLQRPSQTYLMGTDEFGRDLLSRLLFGARIAVQAGLIAVGIAMFGGVLIGLVAGYFGGRVDYFLSRLVEGMQAFPVVLLAIVITAILGPSVGTPWSLSDSPPSLTSRALPAASCCQRKSNSSSRLRG